MCKLFCVMLRDASDAEPTRFSRFETDPHLYLCLQFNRTSTPLAEYQWPVIFVLGRFRRRFRHTKRSMPSMKPVMSACDTFFPETQVASSTSKMVGFLWFSAQTCLPPIVRFSTVLSTKLPLCCRHAKSAVLSRPASSLQIRRFRRARFSLR